MTTEFKDEYDCWRAEIILRYGVDWEKDIFITHASQIEVAKIRHSYMQKRKIGFFNHQFGVGEVYEP